MLLVYKNLSLFRRHSQNKAINKYFANLKNSRWELTGVKNSSFVAHSSNDLANLPPPKIGCQNSLPKIKLSNFNFK